MPSATTIPASVSSRCRLGSIPPLPVVRRHFEDQGHRLVRLGLRKAHVVDDDEFLRGLELVQKLPYVLVASVELHPRYHASELRVSFELLVELGVTLGEEHVCFLRE